MKKEMIENINIYINGVKDVEQSEFAMASCKNDLVTMRKIIDEKMKKYEEDIITGIIWDKDGSKFKKCVKEYEDEKASFYSDHSEDFEKVEFSDHEHDEPKFKTGNIYEVCDINETERYIGSTSGNLNKRLLQHKNKYKNKENNKYYTIYKLFDKFGVENCKIKLIEEIDYLLPYDLKKSENEYIKSMQCVNKNKAYLSEEEKKQNRIMKNEYHNKKSKEFRLKNTQYYNKYYQEKIKEKRKLEQAPIKQLKKENKIKLMLMNMNDKKMQYEKRTLKKYNIIFDSNIEMWVSKI